MHGASNVVCPLMLRAAVPVVFFPVIAFSPCGVPVRWFECSLSFVFSMCSWLELKTGR